MTAQLYNRLLKVPQVVGWRFVRVQFAPMFSLSLTFNCKSCKRRADKMPSAVGDHQEPIVRKWAVRLFLGLISHLISFEGVRVQRPPFFRAWHPISSSVPQCVHILEISCTGPGAPYEHMSVEVGRDLFDDSLKQL